MPIDLKWARSNPDQVREWQNQRRAFPTTKGGDGCADDRSIDLVDDVLRKDDLSRKNLLNLQEHKKKSETITIASQANVNITFGFKENAHQ